MLRSLRNLLRLVRLVWILARHGALFPLELLPQAPGLAAGVRLVQVVRRRDLARRRPGERLAAALVALGPSFIKLGQSLATRSDLIGEEVARDLAQLQDRLPPFPSHLARATIEHELEQPVEALFLSFDDVPVAAASIAQVHFAVTTEGADVAVKVLRPDIERAFSRDLELFHWIAGQVDLRLPWARRLKPRQVVQLFAETVAAEMDMRFEAAAAAELADNFIGDADFHVPAVDWTRTTRRVLTLERIRGLRFDDVAGLDAAGHDPTEILRKSACIFFNQVFRDGFFHADMHPGNVFVMDGGVIAPVDFGIMGRLDWPTRTYLADMLTGFLLGDWRKAAEVHFRAGYVPAHKSIDAFTQACRSIGQPIQGRPLHEISLARLLGQLFAVTERFEMEVQPQLLLLQKTMLVAEGVGRRLNPGVNMWELAQPLVEAWMMEHRSPEARVAAALRDAAGCAERLPGLAAKAEAAINRLTEGGLEMHPDTVRRIYEERARHRGGVWLLWLAAGLVLGALLFG